MLVKLMRARDTSEVDPQARWICFHGSATTKVSEKATRVQLSQKVM